MVQKNAVIMKSGIATPAKVLLKLTLCKQFTQCIQYCVLQDGIHVPLQDLNRRQAQLFGIWDDFFQDPSKDSAHLATMLLALCSGYC